MTYLSLPLLDWKTPKVWKGSVVSHGFSPEASTVPGTKEAVGVGGFREIMEGREAGWLEHQINPGPLLVLRELDYSLFTSEPVFLSA